MLSRAKEVKMMNLATTEAKFVKFRCPVCTNHISGSKNKKGTVTGNCGVCKSIILRRELSPSEILFRIIRN